MINKRKIKSIVKRLPVISGLARILNNLVKQNPVEFKSSNQYWEDRYKIKGDSGDGSYGRLAQFKADVINKFTKDNDIKSVIELGCGDGAQLRLMDYPDYIGVDISETIIEKCKKDFSEDISKDFILTKDLNKLNIPRDLALSLDVIYHLVEDDIFEEYINSLFEVSNKWVIIYSSNKTDQSGFEHVRHRQFTDWIEKHKPDWEFYEKINQKYPMEKGNEDKTSFADFYIFKKKE